MKTSEYRKMSVEDLRSQEAEIRKNLFGLRTRSVTKELENNQLLSQERRDLARVLTIIAEIEAGKAVKA